jgi:hypothetical protein
MVVGECSELCSKVTVPETFESPRRTATGDKSALAKAILSRILVAQHLGLWLAGLDRSGGRCAGFIDESLTCFDHYDGLLVLNTDGKDRFQVVSLALQCRKDEIGET